MDVSFSAGWHQVVCRAHNICGWGQYNVITVEAYAKSASPSQYNIYPNPVSDILHIEIDPPTDVKTPPTYDLRLYDGQGNMLQQAFTQGGTVQFNVSNMPGGVYYLHIYDGVTEKPEMYLIVVEH